MSGQQPWRWARQLLTHTNSIITIASLSLLWNIHCHSIEGLEDYVDYEPNTKSTEDPFSDDEDDV